jgi:hypothetical protein
VYFSGQNISSSWITVLISSNNSSITPNLYQSLAMPHLTTISLALSPYHLWFTWFVFSEILEFSNTKLLLWDVGKSKVYKKNFFLRQVLLCRPDWPGTCDPPASIFQGLEL